MEKIAYQGWINCYHLSNGVVDLAVTADVGPRVIRFGFCGEENEFQEFPIGAEEIGDGWHIYGGHRLWHAPEARPRSYLPDNAPVAAEQHDGFVRIVQPAEAPTGIQKEMDLYLVPGEAHAKVTHRLRNHGMWTVELAPWALSVMARGGKSIAPLPPRGSHTELLLPTNILTLWAYTDMSDPRWTWGNKYILLRQDPQAAHPQKIGAMVPDGWVAYARNGHLFVKTFTYVPTGRYPDFGCSVEMFTNSDFLEVETVAPLVDLQPGASVEHVEHWFLFRDVPVPNNDDDVERDVLPRVRAAMAAAG